MIPVHLRWSDMDAYGHVNNVDMLRYLEIARIEAFWTSSGNSHGTSIVDSGPESAVHMFVARNEIEYRAPLTYRSKPVIVELWISKIGGASLDVAYRIVENADGENTVGENANGEKAEQVLGAGQEPHEQEIYAVASSTLVMVDARTGRPHRISQEQRDAWAPFVQDPVKFRH